MAATDFQSLLSSANVRCYNSAGSPDLLMLALLQIIANALAPTVATDYQSLLSTANVACYKQNDHKLLMLALLQIIANNGTGGGGGGSGLLSGVGNPTSTPATPSLYLDTSTENLWAWDGTSWHQLV